MSKTYSQKQFKKDLLQLGGMINNFYKQNGGECPFTLQEGGKKKIVKKIKKSKTLKKTKKTKTLKKTVKKSVKKLKTSVKKSVKKLKTSVKKLKKVVVYKHKGHTHKTKKALNSCKK